MVNGYYGGENHISEISSPHMPAVESGCKVKFNYQMTGYVGGSLHIFLTLHGMKGRYWSISGDQVRSLESFEILSASDETLMSGTCADSIPRFCSSIIADFFRFSHSQT